MLGQLLAYDAAGNVIACLDYLVKRDPDDPERVLGLHDFGAEEEAGMEFDTEADPDPNHGIWHVEGAAGSKVWPEWLTQPTNFILEKDGKPGRKRAIALVHRVSGHRRERQEIDWAIADRINKADGQPVDLRDIVGGPGRPLQLFKNGKTRRRAKR